MNRWFFVVISALTPLVRILCPIRITGKENIPEGGALICSNHTSAVDIVHLAVALGPRTNFAVMAKDSLFKNKLIGWFFGKMGAFPVNRGGSDLVAMKTALKALQDGKKLVIFPEGTRVEKQGEASAKGGVALLATRTGVPIVPVYCGVRQKFFRWNPVTFGKAYVPQIAGRRATPEENQQIADQLLENIYALKEHQA